MESLLELLFAPIKTVDSTGAEEKIFETYININHLINSLYRASLCVFICMCVRAECFPMILNILCWNISLLFFSLLMNFDFKHRSDV